MSVHPAKNYVHLQAHYGFPICEKPEWLTLRGADVKYLLLANFCYGSQNVDAAHLAQLAGVKSHTALGAFREAKKKLLTLCSTDMRHLSTLTKQMILDEESEEGSTAESSESEIDDSPSKRHNQKAKHIDYAYRKGKGKNTALDIESEDGQSSEVEDNEPSLENFKLPSETQRRNAKQKNTKHSSHAKYSTNHRVAKGRDSPLYADIKSSFSHADRPTIQRKRGVKRDRNPYEFEDESTEESADESSGAEMDASSSRASHSRIKGKRLEKPGRLSGASDNDSDIDEEVGRRAARAFSKANPVKNKYQTGNCKKLDKSNDLAVFRVKDLARQAVDGPTLSGDAPKVKAKSQNWNRKKIGKANDLTGGATDGSTLGGDALETDGRTARSTKHGSGDSMDEEDEEPEEPEIGHV